MNFKWHWLEILTILKKKKVNKFQWKSFMYIGFTQRLSTHLTRKNKNNMEL